MLSWCSSVSLCGSGSGNLRQSRESALISLLVELNNVLGAFNQIRRDVAGFIVNPSDRVSKSDIVPGELHRQNTQPVRYKFCVPKATSRKNQQEVVARQARTKIPAAA